MRIAIIGAGYVGLVSGACLADFGYEVICVDTDEHKIAALRAGRVPIYEPGLSELVLANQAARRLSFTTSLKEAGRGAKAIFIAVGTPSLAEVGSADMHYVYDAARAIAEVVQDFTVVVMKSTVPIGAGDEVERILRNVCRATASLSYPTLNSCARAQRSRTSSSPIVWSLESTTSAPVRSWGTFTSRWSAPAAR